MIEIWIDHCDDLFVVSYYWMLISFKQSSNRIWVLSIINLSQLFHTWESKLPPAQKKKKKASHVSSTQNCIKNILNISWKHHMGEKWNITDVAKASSASFLNSGPFPPLLELTIIPKVVFIIIMCLFILFLHTYVDIKHTGYVFHVLKLYLSGIFCLYHTLILLFFLLKSCLNFIHFKTYISSVFTLVVTYYSKYLFLIEYNVSF